MQTSKFKFSFWGLGPPLYLNTLFVFPPPSLLPFHIFCITMKYYYLSIYDSIILIHMEICQILRHFWHIPHSLVPMSCQHSRWQKSGVTQDYTPHYLCLVKWQRPSKKNPTKIKKSAGTITPNGWKYFSWDEDLTDL